MLPNFINYVNPVTDERFVVTLRPFDYPPYVLKKSADDTLKQGKYFLKAYNNNVLLVFFDDKEFQMFLWDRLLACSLKW